MVQREEAAKPVPESKIQEEKESGEINLINTLNPGTQGWWQEDLLHHHPLHWLLLK